MTTIGIASSIEFSTEMQSSFLTGLNQATAPTLNIQDKKGYGQGLQDAVTLLVTQNVDLIVTFGGLIACKAAQLKDTTIPFISLVGGIPSGFTAPPSGVFVGCVSLESFTLDVVRLSWLNNIRLIAPANVGLLYNSHSVMAQQEVTNWQAAHGGQAVDAVNGWKNPTQFGADFSTFGAGIQAVVVSADPYFYKNRDNLIAAANSSLKYICYPFRGYANKSSTTQPTPGKAVIFGPDLHQGPDAAYSKMGVMAASTAPFGGANPTPAVNKDVAQIIFPL
jgi:hypothetical protein